MSHKLEDGQRYGLKIGMIDGHFFLEFRNLAFFNTLSVRVSHTHMRRKWKLSNSQIFSSIYPDYYPWINNTKKFVNPLCRLVLNTPNSTECNKSKYWMWLFDHNGKDKLFQVFLRKSISWQFFLYIKNLPHIQLNLWMPQFRQ